MQLMSVLGDEITEIKALRLVEMSGGDVNLAISLHFDSLAEGSGGEGDSGDGGAVVPRNAADGSESPSSADEPQDPAGADLLVAHEGPGPSSINSNSTAGGSVMRRSSSLDDHLSSPMRNGTRRPSAPAVEPTPGAIPVLMCFFDQLRILLLLQGDAFPTWFPPRLSTPRCQHRDQFRATSCICCPRYHRPFAEAPPPLSPTHTTEWRAWAPLTG
jgi:hypothetical protein